MEELKNSIVKEIDELRELIMLDGTEVKDIRKLDITELMPLDNKQFIFTCLNFMKDNNLLEDNIIEILENVIECRKMFKCFTLNGIIQKIDAESSFDEQCKDDKGVSRYYTGENEKFEILNQKYYVNSQWKENARPLFVEWINDLVLHSVKVAENILLYGVPGCGKSHEIKTKYCSDDNYMERVVFHPDYTYSDFVGQVMPISDGTNISYPFVPGPFTRILRKASKPENKDNMYYLVIEEINRGNAPAIFGDIFQLLDRNDKGESEYGITNADVAEKVYDNPKQKVKIPGNLTILATMNSSDQNVFTLDTAFKRRWKMRSIKNNIEGCDHADVKICGTSISWKEFATKINEIIIELGKDNLGSEDNRLGAYFVKKDTLNNPEEFAEKVLMYLWNDAIKYDRDKVFVSTYRTLDELIEGFKKDKFKVFLDSIGFVDSNVVTEVQEENNGETTEVGE